MDKKPLRKGDAEKMKSSAGAHDATKTLTLPAGPTRTEAPLAEKQPLNDQSMKMGVKQRVGKKRLLEGTTHDQQTLVSQPG
jgi:hypothetical protein